MPNLSIKNVPEQTVARLRARARLHHRSLQGELMTILEDALQSGSLTVGGVYERVSALGIKTGPESVSMIREDRDAR
ncbi:MAG: Arc family DNA-binding protein [Chloroflexi bacterium]|nr:Arc family DNA-binding protein [Chloroflexota bacterium]MCH8349261.1 Arc family DNA-binding protein [Chloroflexota bacterium]MCI0780119.1 Arc family DNA-binding protein [Chloroflexota bacterium]MCI0785106.1 Arc family DNA-binding protein [Chloroflexota bacterium]MCI0793307.1 Arc family DNA-binding protein [Chloroflexota bacterium]